MALAIERPRFVSREEYLEAERLAETKSEYHDGVVVAMAGATRAHTRIKGDIELALRTSQCEAGCEVLSSDLRVRVEACNKDYYPDVVVICGEARFEDADQDTLTNPAVIFEVLSRSTERFDREDKLDCYGTLESLTDYVLVSQVSPRVERYALQPDGSWNLTIATGLDSSLALPSIGCTVQLRQIYQRVRFPVGPTPETSTV